MDHPRNTSVVSTMDDKSTDSWFGKTDIFNTGVRMVEEWLSNAAV